MRIFRQNTAALQGNLFFRSVCLQLFVLLSIFFWVCPSKAQEQPGSQKTEEDLVLELLRQSLEGLPSLTEEVLKEQVGQMLMLQTPLRLNMDDPESLTEDVANGLIGGILLQAKPTDEPDLARDLAFVERLRTWLDQLQRIAPTPLFIALELDGAMRHPLIQAVFPEAQSQPGSSDRIVPDPVLEQQARFLASLGVNMILLPVADLFAEGRNTPEKMDAASGALLIFQKAGLLVGWKDPRNDLPENLDVVMLTLGSDLALPLPIPTDHGQDLAFAGPAFDGLVLAADPALWSSMDPEKPAASLTAMVSAGADMILVAASTDKQGPSPFRIQETILALIAQNRLPPSGVQRAYIRIMERKAALHGEEYCPVCEVL